MPFWGKQYSKLTLTDSICAFKQSITDYLLLSTYYSIMYSYSNIMCAYSIYILETVFFVWNRKIKFYYFL